jgi:hypothetical protein
MFGRCVASQKGSVLGAAAQPHIRAASCRNDAMGPFDSQPEGNVMKTAPLVVALLAKAASLGVVARLDWRGFDHVRTAKDGANRP